MKTRHQQGFTLIEMIGVLAIIAILVGAVAPRIFEAIQESKANNVSTLHKTVTTAVTKFYADNNFIASTNGYAAAASLGTVTNRDDDGGVNSFSGLLQFDKANSTATQDQSWARFRGPYLDGFVTTAPPVGTEMGIDLGPATNPSTAPSAANDDNFDLDFDADSDVPENATIASLHIEGAGEDMFEKIDAIIDGGLGTNPAVSGKVKYNSTNGDVRVYIAHD